jgi:hypothetical protein
MDVLALNHANDHPAQGFDVTDLFPQVTLN